jgi:hypothetical protein
MLTALPKADDAAVARVEPGGASMPASRRLLVMNPLKVLRVTMEFGRQALKKSVMVNVQGVSCFQEGADDYYWAERRILSPGFEANGRANASGFICLGERCWHWLHEIVGVL